MAVHSFAYFREEEHNLKGKTKLEAGLSAKSPTYLLRRYSEILQPYDTAVLRNLKVPQHFCMVVIFRLHDPWVSMTRPSRASNLLHFYNPKVPYWIWLVQETNPGPWSRPRALRLA